MLVLLGFIMIAVFMTLIMTKKLTPVLALIIVPTVFGLFAGAGLGIGDMVMTSMKSMTSTAALLMFAIMYFGLMIDVGLFDRLVDFIQRISGNDPMKIVVGTAVLAAAVSLDGDGSTTFILTTAALLPIYRRLRMSPVVLTVVAAMANATMNIIPWGGPTARAATALHLSVTDVFVPLVPAMAVTMLCVFAFSWHLGILERRRLKAAYPDAWSGNLLDDSRLPALDLVDERDTVMADNALDPNRSTLRPKLFWFNLLLTLAIMVLLVVDVLPLPYIFMVGVAVAIVVNFPSPKEQLERVTEHGRSIVAVVGMVMAAAVLTGVLSGTGMVDAMAHWLVDVIPTEWGPHLPLITGLLSIPLTFLMSNDAFYFGILPILAQTASQFGVDPASMARASLTGQPFHLQSPLVPAILLLVSLAGVELGDHHKKVLWRCVVLSLVMLGVAILTGAIVTG
ncbi:citrate:proton symporter [Falsarthrobacter nasiphocae]|uniref:CitMHS family citrate-Mg2+:H+ or citrate-Ca2+:H+ symporter n=1 Tax=Falsarthrobacter nasiphocae TaxID=189863 RepID=A0AAE3YDE9_9MICC|nr:citrate:proton symporter [Falsarthrobacter nasiphocae]MDR6891813.1 CitMHS family citrate-Mg2+:H+ or citrate-Ca2+:H+ symporter [Falsarthrobacter nasiphocae]